MKYLVSLKDEKSGDNIYIYTFAPLRERTEIEFGHDDDTKDGLRKWRVMSCSEHPYGVIRR
ncbi:MAG: hypothetical protein J6S14_04925 [Clostridia bacterium]|nr:hypothetical protein [Clostridia bacterium]